MGKTRCEIAGETQDGWGVGGRDFHPIAFDVHDDYEKEEEAYEVESRLPLHGFQRND